MTTVNIVNKSTEPVIVSPRDVKTGNWYQVVEFIHNKDFIGKIGIGKEMLDRDGNPGILTTDGSFFTNNNFKFKKLDQVTITIND